MAKFTAECLVTPDQLRDLLDYDPDTGRLTWRDRPIKYFPDGPGRYSAVRNQKVFQSLFAGRPALTARNPGGYLRGNIFGRSVMAHRAAFCLMTGRWPKSQIDHINGDRADNRWVNLREATNRQNQHNQASAKGSSSRFVGVSQCRESGRWAAYICPDGTKVHLGNFLLEEDAARARDAAAKDMFGAYARLNFPLETENS